MWYQKEAGGIFLCLNIKRDEYEQQQATPCTCGRYALYVVELLSNLRSVTERCYASFSVDLWLLHGCRQAGSDPQPTHAPIPHGREVSWTALPRVYTTRR